MERLFKTHMIRKSRECAPVWTLTTPDEKGLPEPVKVIVPGAWETHPRLRNYRGRGIYEQTVVCGGNVRFFFGGVGFRAKVFLDGKLLGDHYGAYTGFEALARGAKEGEHTLRVEADNRFGEDSALHIPNDYYCWGGLTRSVVTEELGRAYIASCRVTPRRAARGWTADAAVTVRNLAAQPVRGEVGVTVAGREARVNASLEADETAVFTLSVPCGDVTPWSPRTPALYTVSAVLYLDGEPEDDLIDRIGFREIGIKDARILLNGEPVRLRGFNRHEEYGPFGAAVPLQAMMHDIHLMLDLGANCVRTCHYPNDPLFLDLCDENGLMVWEESHARGLNEDKMRHPRFMEQLELSSREMAEQHMNHPCIFIWGSLNECADDTEYGAACYRRIFSLLRSLDGSRPVTAALLERPGGRVYADMDVVSVNMYPKWYHDTPVRETLDRKLREVCEGGGRNKPVIISEIGAGAIYGCHDPFGEARWSEERQCAALRDQITALLSDPRVSGVFLWQFADVRVDDEWAMHRPRTYNNKGVVDEYRRPKLAYGTVKELFGE